MSEATKARGNRFAPRFSSAVSVIRITRLMAPEDKPLFGKADLVERTSRFSCPNVNTMGPQGDARRRFSERRVANRGDSGKPIASLPSGVRVMVDRGVIRQVSAALARVTQLTKLIVGQ